jgi:hypothetical protein
MDANPGKRLCSRIEGRSRKIMSAWLHWRCLTCVATSEIAGHTRANAEARSDLHGTVPAFRL